MKPKLLLNSFQGTTNKIPIWFMRQAGRYLPEYRVLKKKTGSFLQMCTNPDIAAEVSLQPLARFDLDAVIFFCDILTPLIPMGIRVDFIPHPVIANPIRDNKDIVNLKLEEPIKNLEYVAQTLQIIKEKMPTEKTLIGFGGAPFTLAAYLLKKSKDKDFSAIKKFCFSSFEDYQILMEKLTESCYQYLSYQIKSGAEVIQIFDSWAGCFHRQDYEKFVLVWVQKLIQRLQANFRTPIVYYLNGGSHLVDALLKTGADGLSLDWKLEATPIIQQLKKSRKKTLLQGNLDPFHFFSPKEVLKKEIKKIVEDFADHPFIFNVGQGVDQDTPIHSIEFTIEQLRKISQR